jgi:hypothetical protein
VRVGDQIRSGNLADHDSQPLVSARQVQHPKHHGWGVGSGYLPASPRPAGSRRVLIDYILVSERVVVVADGGVWRGRRRAGRDGNRPGRRVNHRDPNSRRDEPGQDHRPLVAALDLT